MVKALFSGAPDGGFAALCKKIDAVNKKAGPMDVAFCVGRFFGQGEASAAPDDALVGYVTGETPMPLPVYFIGGYGAGCQDILEALPASEAKLHYLGRSGVAQVQGLNVAFLDGEYNASAYHSSEDSATSRSPYYTQADVERLKAAVNDLQGEVDVLLTCEWPRGVTYGVPENLLPEGLKPSSSGPGSQIVAEIAALARPRYHFAGGVDVHVARPPYTNKDLGAGPRATRFIALAPANSLSKAKSLHALSLVPAADMEPEQLSQLPEGSTPSPYEAAGQKRGADQDLPEGQDWRWSMKQKKPRRGEGREGGREREAQQVIPGRSDVVKDPYKTVIARNVPFRATESDIVHFFSQAGTVVNVVRGANAEGRLHSWLTVQFDTKESADKALQLHNSELMGRQITVDPAATTGGPRSHAHGVPVDGCWFCLGSSSVDINLVASVGEECYVALDKGAITDDHVLVVPVDHFPSSAALSPSCYEEVERYLSALRSCYAAQGKALVAFERHLALRKAGGNHAHINAIAIGTAAAKRAQQAFEQAARASGFELTVMPPAKGHAALRAAVGDNEYFMALLPDGTRLVRPIMRGERWPMNLGRQVLADLAGVPHRADWKACSSTPEEEAARTEAFKERFKPYDIMAQE